jgi:spermidine synthase
MALVQNPQVHVEVIDLDAMVVEGCKTFLGQKVFDDERVKLHIGDALAYMRESTKKYDGIACDLTDAPVGAKELAEFEEFFGAVISLASQCIRDGGWISVQSGASEVAERYINSVNVIEGILKKHFTSVERRDVLIPSYGESCAFLFGRKG